MTQSVRSHTGPAALIKLAQDVLNTEIAGLAAVRDRLNARTPEKAPLVLALGLLAACTGRVVVTGIGKSGLVGRKLAATFSSTGTPAFFLHPVEGAHGDLGSLRKDDVIIAISKSGETAELNAILPHENIIYFGDTARIPYGSRSPETVLRYAKEDVAFLRQYAVKMIIAACGTVSSIVGD